MTIQRYADLLPPDTNLARGFLWSGTGPANGTIDFVALSAIIAVNYPFIGGRSYLIITSGGGTQLTTAAASIIRIRTPDSDWFAPPGNTTLAVSTTYQVNMVAWYNPPSSGGGTQLLQVMANAPAGVFRIAQNAFRMGIFDMGLNGT